MKTSTSSVCSAQTIAVTRILRSTRALHAARFASEPRKANATSVRLTIAIQATWIFAATFALDPTIDARETGETLADPVDAPAEIRARRGIGRRRRARHVAAAAAVAAAAKAAAVEKA